MPVRSLVSIRIRPGEDRVDITLSPGFTRAHLAVIRTLPGREWNPRRRTWTAPDAEQTIRRLREGFGAEHVLVLSASGAAARQTVERDGEDLLKQVRVALTIRGFSPRTRKVYLGHLRRFLLWCGEGTPRLPQDPVDRGQAYLLDLIEGRDISKSYQNQVVSALRFLCEYVLGRPGLAPRIPRPRKERRLPAVLSPAEVARLLARARNLKHRALLMLLYSAGLRVGEVVRLRPADLDVERGLVRVRKGKGGKDRYTLLADRAVEAVRLYTDAHTTTKWLFPGADPERPLTTRSVQRVVKQGAHARTRSPSRI